MSQGFSGYLITELLNHCFGVGTFPKPVGLTLHLYNGDPHDGGSEIDAVVDDTAYAAQPISFSDEGVVLDQHVHNNALITFDPTVYGSGGAPYDVTHWAIKDGSANLLVAAPFPATINRVSGQPMGLNPSALFVSMAQVVDGGDG